MGSFVVHQQIRAPQERVYALIEDVAGTADRVAGIDRIEMLTDGPLRVGTRWRETRGKMGTEELEIVSLEPGVGYTAACDSCGCHFESMLRCEANEQGTRLSIITSWRQLTLMARLMRPLELLTIPMMRRMMAQDLDGIRIAAESQGEE